MYLPNYKITLGTHKNSEVIFFEFPYQLTLLNELKGFLPVKWSSSLKKWYALDIPSYRQKLNIPPKLFGDSLLPKIHIINQPHFLRMRDQLILKALSPHTIRTYLTEFSQLLSLLNHKDALTLTPDQLRAYMVYCSHKLKLKEATLHSRLNAIKFFYEQVAHQPKLFLDIPRPKKPSSLPKVISKADIKKMFLTIDNPKHKLIIQLVYGMGLRVSEIVQLKVTHIDSNRMMVHIVKAKGKKDRYVPLPQSILTDMRTYFKQYRPQDYLFEGATGGQYSIRSVQTIFKNAMKRAKINKNIGIHGLRHSYATHLLEAGTDMTFIQKLLGHANIKTTLVYAQITDRNIANIESPLDSL